jgi:hypothetical protein|tara:strand:- start:182 stop:361 length:180 start_codon:yes stop_codon:yes gene_type:complete
MSYLQTITYQTGGKEYTEEVIADTPEKAETAINNRLGTTISVQKVLTSVPSTVFTNVLK